MPVINENKAETKEVTLTCPCLDAALTLDCGQAFRAPVRFHETDATNTRGSGGQATLPLFVLHRAGFTMPPWSPSER